MKMFYTRCQGWKVPLRNTYESSRDVNGRIRFKGNPIKRRKGIPYKVDCNVTGSDRGTPTAPKFALKDLWEYTLIPSIEKLVAEGGPCEGANVIFQEDNAGPDCDATYRDCRKRSRKDSGWSSCKHLRVKQPPTSALISSLWVTDIFFVGPYTNVLDLSIFPMMSKRHSGRLQVFNNTEAMAERVWDVAKTVWNETSSSDVARAFVLAYRIMQLIIDENGNNRWLADGTPHCNVRADFINTTFGIHPRNNQM